MRRRAFGYICDECKEFIGFGYPRRRIKFKFRRKHFCSEKCLKEYKRRKK